MSTVMFFAMFFLFFRALGCFNPPRDFLIQRIENKQKALSKMKLEYLEELFQEEFKFRSMFQQDAQNHGADTSADELYRYAALAAKESCKDMQEKIDIQQKIVANLEQQLVEMDAKIETSKKLPPTT